MNQLSAIFKNVKGVWMRFAHRLGRFQARVLLTCVFILVLPFMIFIRLGKKTVHQPSWDKARKFPATLQEAQEIF